MNINLEYYKIFYIIAIHGNITKASEQLMVSQPAISRIINTLEKQLGVNLFIRNKKGVILTKEGEELFYRIEGSMSNLIKVDNNIKAIISNDNYKIFISHTLLDYCLSPLLSNKITTTSNLAILSECPFSRLNHRLVNNLIDSAIITNMNDYHFDDRIKKVKLTTLHIILVTHKAIVNNPAKNTTMIFPMHGKNIQSQIEKIIQTNNLQVTKTIYTDTFEGLVKLITNGWGRGFIIKELLQDQLNNGTLIELDIKENITVELDLLFNQNRQTDENIQKIINLFKDN